VVSIDAQDYRILLEEDSSFGIQVSEKEVPFKLTHNTEKVTFSCQGDTGSSLSAILPLHDGLLWTPRNRVLIKERFYWPVQEV